MLLGDEHDNHSFQKMNSRHPENPLAENSHS